MSSTSLWTALAGAVALAFSIGACGAPQKAPLVPDVAGDDGGAPDMPAPPTTSAPTTSGPVPVTAPPPPPG